VENRFFMAKESKPVCIFDFDYTISRHHLHISARNIINQLLAEGNQEAAALFKDKINAKTNKIKLEVNVEEKWSPEQQAFIWDKLKAAGLLEPTGNKEEWRAIFKTLIEANYPVYIASFSSFKFLIERFLQDEEFGLGLSKPELDAIQVLSCLPSKEDNKNMHVFHVLRQEKGEIPRGTPFSDTLENEAKLHHELEEMTNRKELPDEGLANYEIYYKDLLKAIPFALIDDTDRNTNGIHEYIKTLIRHASEQEEPELKMLQKQLEEATKWVDRSQPDGIPKEVMAYLSKCFAVSFDKKVGMERKAT